MESDFLITVVYSWSSNCSKCGHWFLFELMASNVRSLGIQSNPRDPYAFACRPASATGVCFILVSFTHSHGSFPRIIPRNSQPERYVFPRQHKLSTKTNHGAGDVMARCYNGCRLISLPFSCVLSAPTGAGKSKDGMSSNLHQARGHLAEVNSSHVRDLRVHAVRASNRV